MGTQIALSLIPCINCHLLPIWDGFASRYQKACGALLRLDPSAMKRKVPRLA